MRVYQGEKGEAWSGWVGGGGGGGGRTRKKKRKKKKSESKIELIHTYFFYDLKQNWTADCSPEHNWKLLVFCPWRQRHFGDVKLTRRKAWRKASLTGETYKINIKLMVPSIEFFKIYIFFFFSFFSFFFFFLFTADHILFTCPKHSRSYFRFKS